MAAGAPTIGVDLGGTNLRVGVVDAGGHVLEDRRVPAPTQADDIVETIAITARELAARNAASVVGIGAAGMVAHDGTIQYAPNLTALVGLPLRARIAALLDMAVAVDNDANVAVLAELAHGVAQGRSDVLLITLGTGIGGGIVTGGRLLRGAHGFAAEIGHFQVDPHGPRCACGQVGHWEAIASGRALGALGRAEAEAGRAPSVLASAGGDPTAITGVHVGAAAVAGEPDAVAILAVYAERVAIGLAGLANIFDPELVIVSGGLVELGDTLLGPVRRSFEGRIEGASRRPGIDIVPAALGEQAGVIGAAVLARALL
jgi:glucokinase